MVSITPGTGATISSDTAEGQLVETVAFLRQQEQDSTKNPNLRTSVAGTISLTSKVFSGTIDLLTEVTINSTGNAVVSIKETLSGVDFSAGSGGTFKSNTPLNYLAEIVTYLQIQEASELSNPQSKNYITSTINSDAQTLTGTFSLPIEYTFDKNGGICFQTAPYLD